MKIYKEELALAEQIFAQKSVAFCTQVVEADSVPEVESESAFAALKINIETPKTEDLYYTRSILVSTGFNNNDDVFHPHEVWKARKTPVDKPTNIEHDDSRIVGHITSNWVIDNQGNILEDNLNIEDVPSVFHIVNGAVIYKQWQSQEYKDMAFDLIKEIKEGSYYVSMECLFNDFDYAIKDGDKIRVIPRDETSAFLTAHLRLFGGSGIYEDKRLGRLLKNINFSGKGYVKKPANPKSVIFENDNINEFSFAGVYDICSAKIKESDMSQEIIEDLKGQIKELSKANQSLKDEIASADAARYQNQVEELKASLKNEQELRVKEQEAKACMCDQYEELAKKNEELVAELNSMKECKKKDARVGAFIERGFSKEDAEAKAGELSALDDTTFEKVIKLIPAVACCQKVAPINLEELEEEVEVEASVDVTDEKENVFAALVESTDKYFSEKWSNHKGDE